MATLDTPGSGAARTPPRTPPGPEYLWALLLAVLHAVVVPAATLHLISYAAFLPGVGFTLAQLPFMGVLVGVLLLVVVLTVGRWWRVTGLVRLSPVDGWGSAWTVLPLLVLVVAGAVVGRLQFGALLDGGLAAAATGRVHHVVVLALVLVSSVLLSLALVPHLLGASGESAQPPLYVVLMTGVVIGLATIGGEAVYAAYDPAGGFYLGAELPERILAQGMLVLPFVAVAVRTGAPWLLAPVLAVRLATVGPTGGWFWAYAALGAVYAVALTLGPRRGSGA